MQISYDVVFNVACAPAAGCVPLTVSKVLKLLVKERKTEKSNTKPLQSSQSTGRFLTPFEN